MASCLHPPCRTAARSSSFRGVFRYDSPSSAGASVLLKPAGRVPRPIQVQFRKGRSMIEAQNLSRRYGDFTAVDGISLSVGEGEIVGILGPNGAGKTTTIRMITGFLPP